MKKFWKTVEVSELTTNSYQILLDKKILNLSQKKVQRCQHSENTLVRKGNH